MTPAKAVPSLALALLLLAGSPAVSAPADRPAGDAADLGDVDFPTSGPADAQQHFLRGVLWLHSFEYDDARTEFARARELAPGFAMAYWGEAMSHDHPVWASQDLAAGRAVLEALGADRAARLAKAPTEREKGYLAAVEALYFAPGEVADRDRAHAEAMERLHRAFPDDDEAAAFYALALLGTCQGERDFTAYMKAAAVAEEVFRRNPRHPGALHYLIHSYDDPVHGPLGLRPARIYAEVAPSAPHALHMPSHIFLALGMWDDSAASNQASWRAAVERGGSNLHALWWLAYTELQRGRFDEARRAMETLRDGGEADTGHGRRHLALMRAAYRVDSRRWQDELPAVDPAELGLEAAAAELYAGGRAALAGDDLDGARAALASLGARRTAAGSDPDDERVARIAELELAALVRLAAGDGEAALGPAREAVAASDAAAFEFGPPVPVEPAHEVLGELLLALGRPAEAAAEYRLALDRAPGRLRALAGLAEASAAAGEPRAAAEALAALAAQWRAGSPPPAAGPSE